MAPTNHPHPEEAVKRPSRRTQAVGPISEKNNRLGIFLLTDRIEKHINLGMFGSCVRALPNSPCTTRSAASTGALRAGAMARHLTGRTHGRHGRSRRAERAAALATG